MLEVSLIFLCVKSIIGCWFSLFLFSCFWHYLYYSAPFDLFDLLLFVNFLGWAYFVCLQSFLFPNKYIYTLSYKYWFICFSKMLNPPPEFLLLFSSKYFIILRKLTMEFNLYLEKYLVPSHMGLYRLCYWFQSIFYNWIYCDFLLCKTWSMFLWLFYGYLKITFFFFLVLDIYFKLNNCVNQLF